jgi:hypothetical protein
MEADGAFPMKNEWFIMSVLTLSPALGLIGYGLWDLVQSGAADAPVLPTYLGVVMLLYWIVGFVGGWGFRKH